MAVPIPDFGNHLFTTIMIYIFLLATLLGAIFAGKSGYDLKRDNKPYTAVLGGTIALIVFFLCQLSLYIQNVYYNVNNDKHWMTNAYYNDSSGFFGFMNRGLFIFYSVVVLIVFIMIAAQSTIY